MSRASYKVVISGVVQGVGFRASMKDAAIRYGVDGWVRNRDDGAVEALVQGEESQVEELLAWARVGPPGAAVLSIVKSGVDDSPPQSGFHVLVQGSARGRPLNR
jgi:acylphosphatase